MNQDGFKKLLNEALEPIKKQLVSVEGELNDPVTGLAAINNRLDANTTAVVELETTIKGYADAYKTNKANIEKLDDRVIKLEDKAGLVSPPEFTIQR